MASTWKQPAIWVKALVLFHLFVITAWSLPNPANAILNGRVEPRGNEVILVANFKSLKLNPVVRAYVFHTGTWQYWDMFAPNPASVDIWGDAEVLRQDGTMERYQYPRMYLLPIPNKYVLERYRKFYERANMRDYEAFWPQFALVVARKMDTDPKNRPVRVKLYRHAQGVPKIGAPKPTAYTNEFYFERIIRPEDLDGKP